MLNRITAACGADNILDSTIFRGELTCLVKTEAVADICNTLKSDESLKFDFCSDVVGVDYLTTKPRFGVLYHLYSISKTHRVRIKVKVDDGESVPSVANIWRSADCAEREVYDLFGIVFDGHPDLKRIYMPHDWEGHPLRKDYPLRGYKDEYNPFGEERE
ncbi:MAG: NADH-quinone oxidoreductase subunit C [Thermodesulfobacteriota bacterium]